MNRSCLEVWKPFDHRNLEPREFGDEIVSTLPSIVFCNKCHSFRNGLETRKEKSFEVLIFSNIERVCIHVHL